GGLLGAILGHSRFGNDQMADFANAFHDDPEGLAAAQPTRRMPAPTRPFSERLVQSLCFEISGLLLSLPLLSHFSDYTPLQNVVLLAVLAVVVMMWSAVHNATFDIADFHCSGRVASDRPQRWRIVHALSHEISSILVSLPVLVWGAGMTFQTALFIDLSLTALYASWAWVFFLVWDRLRPLQAAISADNPETEK
ncbi:MAG: chlorhexidine efflux transporter, partial [Pseudomonadota bacterium]